MRVQTERRTYRAVLVNEDVATLDITVDTTLLVDIVQPLQHFTPNAGNENLVQTLHTQRKLLTSVVATGLVGSGPVV